MYTFRKYLMNHTFRKKIYGLVDRGKKGKNSLDSCMQAVKTALQMHCFGLMSKTRVLAENSLEKSCDHIPSPVPKNLLCQEIKPRPHW